MCFLKVEHSMEILEIYTGLIQQVFEIETANNNCFTNDHYLP